MRLSEIISYDSERPAVVALNWRAGAEAQLRLNDLGAIAEALETGVAADRDEAARLACLGLAIVAQTWRDRPSDARRGALIQAAERLRARLARYDASDRLDEALTRADAALLAGSVVHEQLLALAEEEGRRVDRAAERCGRHAADLLDDDDQVLALALGGRSLAWTLHATLAQGRTLNVYVPAALEAAHGSRRLAHWAAQRGITISPATADQAFSICLAEAALVALNGGVILAPDALPHARQARRRAPLYALAPTGPDATITQLQDAGASDDPGGITSAIITSRGVYRPAMVARYLSEDDTPLDVIPLL